MLYVNLLDQKILVTEALFVITLLLFFTAIFIKQITINFKFFYIPLGLYFFALTLSTIFSVNPTISIVKLAGIAYLIGLAVISFVLISDYKLAKQVCLVWLLGSFLSALVVFLTLVLFYIDRSNLILHYTLSPYGSLPVGNYPRINSTFSNANAYCYFLSISWLILFISYFKRWIGNTVFVVLLLLFTIASIFTISPSLGGILLSIGMWFWVYLKWKEQKKFSSVSIVCGVFCAVMFFAASALTIDFTSGSFMSPQFGTSVRVETWKSAANTFLENPLFGKGLGTHAGAVHYKAPDGSNQYLRDAHQMFLNVAAEDGVLGLFSIIFLGIYLGGKLLPINLKSDKSVLRMGLGIAFISCFFYQGLSGSYEDSRHLWVLIGFLGAVSAKEFSETDSESTSGLTSETNTVTE